MIFPGFPGVLSFFQVFQVEWEPCQTLIPLIFKTDSLDLISPFSHMTKPSLIGPKYMASNWPLKSHEKALLG